MEKVTVSLKQARADIRLKAGAPLEVANLRQAVTQAGFTPTWVEFEATGQLVRRNGRTDFKVKGSEQVISIKETKLLAGLREKASGGEITIQAIIPENGQMAEIRTFRAP